uniref:hypothetical protein n=1 Tax=Agathobacter sp. TaxID=2021311 RepID=UPI0040575275
MKEVLKKFLFSKQILVNESGTKNEDAFSVVLTLARLFNIKIMEGAVVVRSCDYEKIMGYLR